MAGCGNYQQDGNRWDGQRGGVFLLVGSGNQLVRYIGLALMLATPLAAVGLHHLTCAIPESEVYSLPVRRLALAGLLCVGVLVAIPTYHHAPYTARPGSHVPEGQYESFETVFEYASTDAIFTNVRSEPFRYHNAIYGHVPPELSASYLPGRHTGGVPPHFRDIEQVYPPPFYVAVTHADVRRDAGLYEGFKYSHDDFERLRGQSGTHRVYDSEHVWVYLTAE